MPPSSSPPPDVARYLCHGAFAIFYIDFCISDGNGLLLILYRSTPVCVCTKIRKLKVEWQRLCHSIIFVPVQNDVVDCMVSHPYLFNGTDDWKSILYKIV